MTSPARTLPEARSIAAERLDSALQKRLAPEAYDWFTAQLEKIQRGAPARDFDIAFGLIPRKLGRADLNPETALQSAARETIPGWDLSTWSVDIAARARLLITLTEQPPEQLDQRLTALLHSADAVEAIAIYSALPLLGSSETIQALVGEGLRSNVSPIFDAIAHRNPWPAEHFNDHRWNHMVLKALFIDRPLYLIQGLDQRRNAELARILDDTVGERLAAARAVPVELWRLPSRWLSPVAVERLCNLAATGSALEQDAAVLALHENASVVESAQRAAVSETLNTQADRLAAIKAGTLNWTHIGERADAARHT